MNDFKYPHEKSPSIGDFSGKFRQIFKEIILNFNKLFQKRTGRKTYTHSLRLAFFSLDTKTSQRHHKKRTDWYPWWTQVQKSFTIRKPNPSTNKEDYIGGTYPRKARLGWGLVSENQPVPYHTTIDKRTRTPWPCRRCKNQNKTKPPDQTQHPFMIKTHNQEYKEPLQPKKTIYENHDQHLT